MSPRAHADQPGQARPVSPGDPDTSVSLVEHARLDLPARGLPDLVRASVHYYNTDDELDQLIDALPTARPTRSGAGK